MCYSFLLKPICVSLPASNLILLKKKILWCVFSFLNCIKIHKTFDRALGKSYQRITNMSPKTLRIGLNRIPHLYSNACCPVSPSVDAPVVSRKKISLSAVRSIWNWSSFSSIVQCSTVTEVRNTRAFLKPSLSVIHFLKQL